MAAGFTTLQIKDGNGVLQTFSFYQDGSGNYYSAPVLTDGNGNVLGTSAHPLSTKASDPSAVTGSITATDSSMSSTTNSIGQTIRTGSPTANSSVSATLSANSSIAVQLSGTFSGTISFFRSIDGGTTYVPFSLEEISVGAAIAALTISDNKAYVFRANSGVLTTVLIICTSFTSGTCNVRIQAGNGISQVISNQGPPNSAANAWTNLNTGQYNTVLPTLTNGNIGTQQFDANSIGYVNQGRLSATASSPDSILNAPLTTTTGGAVPHHYISGASNNATSIITAAAQVYGLIATNFNTTNARFVKFYNKASTPSPASDTPYYVITLPAAASASMPTVVIDSQPMPLKFTTGVAFAMVGGEADNDNTSIGASDVTLDFRASS